MEGVFNNVFVRSRGVNLIRRQRPSRYLSTVDEPACTYNVFLSSARSIICETFEFGARDRTIAHRLCAHRRITPDWTLFLPDLFRLFCLSQFLRVGRLTSYSP